MVFSTFFLGESIFTSATSTAFWIGASSTFASFLASGLFVDFLAALAAATLLTDSFLVLGFGSYLTTTTFTSSYFFGD